MAQSSGPIGGRWYSTLKSRDGGTGKSWSLFSAIPRSEACRYFIVRSRYKEKYRFAAFLSSVEFYLWYRNILRYSAPEIHEVILGEKVQKARFDIDLTLKDLPPSYRTPGGLKTYGDNLRNRVLLASQQVLQDHGVNFSVAEDAIICVSHSQDVYSGEAPNDNSKYSCHIILNVYHYNYEEAAQFYALAIDKHNLLREASSRGILDAGIYKSIVSLRLIGSGKDKRVKTYLSQFSIGGSTIDCGTSKNAVEELDFFRRTTITDVTNARYVNIIVPIKESTSYSSLPEGTAESSVELLTKHESGDSFAYHSLSGGLVLLKRLKPSYCKLCDRVHESTDPFLQITPGGNVYFHCRRAVGHRKKYFMGTVDIEAEGSSSPESSKGSDSEKDVQPKRFGGNLLFRASSESAQTLSNTEELSTTNLRKGSTVSTCNDAILNNNRPKGCDWNKLKDLCGSFFPEDGLPQKEGSE